MIVNSLDGSLFGIRGWHERMAQLTKAAWTGEDGKCYFPYLPLTMEDHWCDKVFAEYQADAMRSFVWVNGDGQFTSHAAMVRKEGYWELGRWVTNPGTNPPRGVIRLLSNEVIRSLPKNTRIVVEATQAHTTSQWISDHLGLRFAGIGFLAKIDGINWDIIYFDNMDFPPFVPALGLLGDPLGISQEFLPFHQNRLEEVSATLTSKRNGGFPPTQFHVLPKFLPVVQEILRLNL